MTASSVAAASATASDAQPCEVVVDEDRDRSERADGGNGQEGLPLRLEVAAARLDPGGGGDQQERGGPEDVDPGSLDVRAVRALEEIDAVGESVQRMPSPMTSSAGPAPACSARRRRRPPTAAARLRADRRGSSRPSRASLPSSPGRARKDGRADRRGREGRDDAVEPERAADFSARDRISATMPR